MALSEAEKYRLAQARIRGQVHGAVNRLYAEVVRQKLGPEAIRDLFLDRLPLLVERFGEDASAFAAEWYDELRSRHGSATYYRAEMAPLSDGWREMVEATTRRAAGHLWTDTPDDMLPGVIDMADKIVGEAASRTIANNAKRDPDRPRYTVTLSANACPYCRDVAREVERLRPGEQPSRWFHGGCRCVVTPNWAAGHARAEYFTGPGVIGPASPGDDFGRLGPSQWEPPATRSQIQFDDAVLDKIVEDHRWPGREGKSPFPPGWDRGQIQRWLQGVLDTPLDGASETDRSFVIFGRDSQESGVIAVWQVGRNRWAVASGYPVTDLQWAAWKERRPL